MGTLLIVGLVLAWFAVLGPTVFQRSDERRPSSLDAARDRLAALHQTRRVTPFHDVQVERRPTGSSPTSASPRGRGLVPASAKLQRVRRRRRQVFQMLVGSCVLTLLLAVGTSAKALWGLQLVTDGVLGAYVLLLRSMRNPGRAARPVGRTVSVDRVGHSGHGSGLVDAADRWVDDSWTEDPLHARWSRVANG